MFRKCPFTIDPELKASFMPIHVMEGFELFKRLGANQPNRKLVESKRPKRRLKQNLILDIAARK